MTPEGLTDSWLSSVLHTEVRVGEATRIGDGLVGMNVRLTLESDGTAPSSLIAKLPSPDPTSRATGIGLRNYEREVCFYLELAKLHGPRWGDPAEMFAAMATRHAQHVLDLDSESLL